MWKSRLLWARFPRGSWKEWEAGLWLSTLSTARHFHSSVVYSFSPRPRGCWELLLVGVFLPLAVLQPVTLPVHLQDVDVVC
jgi:hypothetical protein